MNILLLFGGMAEEHDVSVKSAREIYRALNRAPYAALCVYIARDGAWRLVDSPEGDLTAGARVTLSADRSNPGLIVYSDSAYTRVPVDAAFPALHGHLGEDGAIQGLLELAGIPYVGCPVAASALCMDKSLTYMAASAAGVKVPKHWTVQMGDAIPVSEIAYPAFVKPARSGSSFGVSKVYKESGLSDAVADARRYDDKILIEEAVPGIEVGCAVLGRDEEIVTGELDEIALTSGFFRIHQEKNPEKGSENARIRVPAIIDPSLRRRVDETARAVYRAVGARGLARVDLFASEDGAVTLNEVNTMPGFTVYSRYPGMMRAAGIGMEELIDRLIALALDNREKGRESA